MTRIAKLQGLVPSWGVDLLLIEHPIDLFYLTGMQVSTGTLWVTCKAALLFLDGRYLSQGNTLAPCPVRAIEQLKEHFSMGMRVGFDSASVTYARYLACQQLCSSCTWHPILSPLQGVRQVKEWEEIEALKRAAHITWQGYRSLFPLLHEGVRERELAERFESFCRQAGASGLSFPSIIAFGENSAYPHHRAGDRPLRKGDSILIDVGAIVDSYCGDMSRLLFFQGRNPHIDRFYRIVREAHRRASQMLRPGVTVKEVDQQARSVFAGEGVESLFSHSLGHGIGLEVHEFPKIRCDGPDRDVVFQENMLITIEPGLYQAGLGGVRYEDTLLLTREGAENLYPPEDDVDV